MSDTIDSDEDSLGTKPLSAFYLQQQRQQIGFDLVCLTTSTNG